MTKTQKLGIEIMLRDGKKIFIPKWNHISMGNDFIYVKSGKVEGTITKTVTVKRLFRKPVEKEVKEEVVVFIHDKIAMDRILRIRYCN